MKKVKIRRSKDSEVNKSKKRKEKKERRMENAKLKQNMVQRLTISIDQSINPPSVVVHGIPISLSAALRHMNAGYETIVRMFLDKSQKGELNGDFEITTKSTNLITPVKMGKPVMPGKDELGRC